MALRVGDTAPAFDVTSSDGKSLRLADFRGKKNVVLYFYPKDFTPGCTAEACGFRDMYEELVTADTEVIGVSADDDASHRDFATKHRVPFPLVADPDKKLARSYDAVGGLSGLFGRTGRITYIIGKDGVIAGVYDSLMFAKQHLAGVKSTLHRLGDAKASQ